MQRVGQRALDHRLASVAKLQRLLHGDVQVLVHLVRGQVLPRRILSINNRKQRYHTTYDDIELGIDVGHLVLVVDDGQRRHAPFDHDVQCLDQWRALLDHRNLVVGANVQLLQ